MLAQTLDVAANTVPKSEELWRYREAAAFLDITVPTLQTWVSTQRYSVPYLKIGRCVRFRRSALERWLHRRERGGKAER